MDFAEIVKKLIDQNVRLAFHYGEVTAHSTSPKNSVSVKISGSTEAISGVRFLDSYAPQVGDIVLILVNKNDALVIGNLAS